MSEDLSLAGLRVVVTRAAHQAGELAAAFEEAGAAVVHLPLLAVEPPLDSAPLERAAAELDTFHWIVFPSANAALALLARARPPASVRLAAVGAATAETLARRGLEVSLVPRRQDAEGLLDELLPHLAAGEAVLLPQADDARTTLAGGLAAAGHAPRVVTAYRKVLPPEGRRLARRHLAGDPLGWVTFTSPRIVEHFVELLGQDWERRRAGLAAASIGPVTSAALRRHGAPPRAEAGEPTAAALVTSVAATRASTTGAGRGRG